MTIDRTAVKNGLRMVNYAGCGFLSGAIVGRMVGGMHPLIKLVCFIPATMIAHKAAELANDQLDIFFDEVVDPALHEGKKLKEKMQHE